MKSCAHIAENAQRYAVWMSKRSETGNASAVLSAKSIVPIMPSNKLRLRFENAAHIVGQRRGKFHPFPGDGVGEAQAVGVERLSCHKFHVGVIQIVPDQRKAEIFHVNTDLVCAAGLQLEREETVPIFFFYDSVMRDGMFTVLEIHHTLYDGAGLPG